MEAPLLFKHTLSYIMNSKPSYYLKVSAGECSLGFILLAQSPTGLRSIFIGDNLHSLLKELKIYFPSAIILKDQNTISDKTNLVCRYADNPKDDLDLKLDLQGTPFQLRVWQAIKDIPAGETRSYKDIAKKVQHPKAMRAVAQVCANNMHALAIPCHRVIRYDGRLGGYRWGIHRKEILLNREKTLYLAPNIY